MKVQPPVPFSLRCLVSAIFLAAFGFLSWHWYGAKAETLRAAEPQQRVVTPVKPPIVTPPASPKQSEMKERTNPKDGAVMVFVPAGEFLMGSDEGSPDEKPVHRVTLDGYWIYRYEVTVAQYRKFCQETGREMPTKPPWGWEDDYPVVNVSWEQARAYCEWAGGRLPTEAEWEKAARGTDGRKYPWGNDWVDNWCAHAIGMKEGPGTVPVGSYPRGVSPYGLYDMSGNALEWVADWYSENYYATAPPRNPTGPESSTTGSRVVRGGARHPKFVAWHLRCTSRYWTLPDFGFDHYGFRCVADADT